MQQITSTMKIKKEKSKNLEKKHKIKRQNLNQLAEEKSQEKQREESKKNSALTLVESNQIFANQIQNQIASANQKHSREMENLLETFGSLERQVEQYHQTLLQNVNNELIE